MLRGGMLVLCPGVHDRIVLHWQQSGREAPAVHALFLREVSGEPAALCIRELLGAKQTLEDEGCSRMPSWEEAAQGAKAPYPEDLDAGEWRRGWQYHASSARELHFSERVVLPASSRSRRAMLLSGSGRGAGRWRSALPTSPGTSLKPLRMQVALRRRLRWPLPLGPRRCNGRMQLQEGARPAW